MEQSIDTLTHSLLHFTILSVTIMSAMPGPIPGSHTASHELTRIYTLTIHDATHLPLCASTGGGLGAIPSLLFQSPSITTNQGDFDSDSRRHGHKCQD